MLENPFKLTKLKIHAYATDKRTSPIATFEAMFNPASFQQKFQTTYAKHQAINSSGSTSRYSHSRPTELKLKLILDGSGVTEMGISLFGKQQSVAERVDEFLHTAYHMNGDIHEPNYLAVEWGDLSFWGTKQFNCRLGSVDISYTSFQRDGNALRAELDVTLFSDEEAEKRAIQEDKKSPDLTQTRIVRAGDTLPLLCKEIYGQPHHYLRVAQVNHLNNFRNLEVGKQLLFPPLVTQ